MNPDLVKRLSDIPAIKDFIYFLDGEAAKLNQVKDITATDLNELALEVLARKRAYDIVIGIIQPLLATQSEVPGRSNPAEFLA